MKNELKNIKVLCYSEEQGLPHLETLESHIECNRTFPNNQYFIVQPLDTIPKEVFADKELYKYIRFKSPSMVDFSNLQIDIPEIGIYKQKELEEVN